MNAIDDNLSALAGWNSIALLLAAVVVELVLLQALAFAVATGIYHLTPLVGVAESQIPINWLGLFQVISPSLTLPGGVSIVLSAWLLTRRAQRAEQRADAIEKNAAERVAAAEAAAAVVKEQAAVAAEAAVAAAVAAAREQADQEIAALRAELERYRAQS